MPDATAVGVVVHLPGSKGRRVTVVQEPQLQLAPEHRRERLLLGEPAEGVGDLREHVDAHGDPGYPLPPAQKVAHDDDTSCVEIDQADGVLDHRHERAIGELEVVVGHARVDADDSP